MTTKQINYMRKEIPNTTAVYAKISSEEWTWLVSNLVQINSYFGELTASKSSDIKAVLDWWITPSKSLPYSGNFKNFNSPASFVSGLINNFLANGQRDFTESQLEHVQKIFNQFYLFKEAIDSTLQYKIQKNSDIEKIQFVNTLNEKLAKTA